MANFDPYISKTVQPILTKLETYNYLPKTTRHVRSQKLSLRQRGWSGRTPSLPLGYKFLFSHFFLFF